MKKCRYSKQALIEYFFDEMQDSTLQEFSEHLSTCESCSAKLQELQATCHVLEQSKLEIAPAFDFSALKPASISNVRKPFMNRLFGRSAPVLGFAAGAVVALFAVLLLNLKANYSDGRLTLEISSKRAQTPETPDASANLVTQEELARWQRKTLLEVEQMLVNAAERQQGRYNHALTSLVRDLEAQRRNDLMRVGRGLEAFQFSNQDQIRRTQEMVNRLIEVSSPNRSNRSRDNQ